MTIMSTVPDDELEKARFYIDHGMIHDRVTGKHVDTSPVEFDEGQFDASPTHETCALLNELAIEASGLSRLREALEKAGELLKTSLIHAEDLDQYSVANQIEALLTEIDAALAHRE